MTLVKKTIPIAPYQPHEGGVKGAKVIYAPSGQAGEYAALATNPYNGCGHKCAYCYVPIIMKMDRKEFDAGAVARKNYLAKVAADCERYAAHGVYGQVMLSFTTDPYHPGDSTLTRETLQTIAGSDTLSFCTLTKGGSRALRDLELFRPNKDAFASTLTSMDDAFSLKWERGAALISDRVATLRKFHEAGIFTWVSLEPTLDADASIEIVEQTRGFVDLYKIGRVNYLPMTRTTDWKDYTLRMIEVVQKLGVKHYFKEDLQPYLPAGYANPKRIPQHH